MGNGVKDFQALLGGAYDTAADRVVCDNYLSQEEGLSEEEREQRIKEYLSLHCEMEKCLYLTGETMLKCTEGSMGAIFEPTDHNVNFNGETAIAATDCKVGEHIKSFGVCFAQSSPEAGAVLCNPKIAHDKWLESCSRMKVGDEDSVNENSFLICVRGKGGKIYPVLGNGITDEGPDIEEQIQDLIGQIKGEKITTYKEMVGLPTVEILARLIYQEDHEFRNGRQNAIAFSIVNRLFDKGYLSKDKLGEKKSNNLYGVITSGGQYQSIFDEADANEKINKGNHNAYWPPTEETANEHEKEAWENAERLAAITYLAVEYYGEGEERDEGRCVQIGSEDARDNIINFMEEQVDSIGNSIENKIETHTYFRPYGKYDPSKEIVLEEGAGNVFYSK